ncbi:MAG: damage-inducible protein, partial [Verrucomicrobiales bacterium VVV1]
GTGTFITRLLQSGLIKPEELPHKYRNEIHANEIVLLAYYIAAINIEAVYHSLISKHAATTLPSVSYRPKIKNPQSSIVNPSSSSIPNPSYEPFQGICLTDTFQLYEKGDLISNLLENNSARRKRQKALDIRVIMGTPPYSKGQESANDNNENVSYEHLDGRIRDTYADRSEATNKNALYNSYIRAIRWASDRVGESGVVGFVSGAGFLEANTGDGLRRCLTEEFSSIYVFHLRGNAHKSGEQRRKEKGNVFGEGSRSPIAITLLLKNPRASHVGRISFYDIGDYLSSEEKLSKISELRCISGIAKASGWQSLTPDSHGDWLKQRNESFSAFIVLGDKKGDSATIFENYSRGLETARDAWCFNFSERALKANTARMIGFYGLELERFKLGEQGTAKDFVNNDATRISWSSSLLTALENHRSITHRPEKSTVGFYRPFTKTWVYYEPSLIHRMGQLPSIFPRGDDDNLVLMIKQRWSGDGNFALVFNKVVELQTDGGSQCFPLYLYDKGHESAEGDLFGKGTSTYTRRDAITDAGLSHFQQAYPAEGEGSSITKEDLFYYIYGLLHSPDYRSRYADNLGKELPRIPAVKTFADFMAFSQAGRDLAHWHLNYETVACHPGVTVAAVSNRQAHAEDGAGRLESAATYRVTKMKFGKTKDPQTGKNVNDKTTVIYNEFITIENIPLEAYDYVVNGKPALEWVMERQSVTTDKDSGITNDANLWATETMGNERYPLELLLRVITVSLETMKIVNGLPGLDIA